MIREGNDLPGSRSRALCLLVVCALHASVAQGGKQRSSPPRAPHSGTALQRFDHDLEEVRSLLHVPGMAAAIVEGDRIVWKQNLGFADNETKVPVTDSTEFCIASVSKTMAAVILMQLRQDGKVRIDDRLSKYIPESTLPKNITLRQIMSHTSDGTPGEEFLYNGARYALLSRVVERVTGVPYATVVSKRILGPLKMEQTIPGLEAPGYQERQQNLAKPYRWDQNSPTGIQAGDLPAAGLSAATGMVSTVGDLARYAMALDGNELANPESKALMFTPTRSLRGEDLPYGLGWFVQNDLGQQLVWHYGQEDSYASLLVRVPNRKMTLIVLANSNAMSDAFRLLDGNAMRSLLVLDFLRDIVLPGQTSEPSVRNQLESEEAIDRALAWIYLDELNQALPYARAAVASGLLSFPPDLTTLYALTRFDDPGLKQATEALGMDLIERHPHFSPALFYLATYYQAHAQPEKAVPLFERIAGIQPPLRHWTASLALLELAKWYADRDPKQARKYLQQIVATGYNFAGAVDEAKAMLAKLPGP